MFSFFQRKNIIGDIQWLGVDIHSHLLPGIDDGSKSIDQSLGYIYQLQELGFHSLYCTPHIFHDLYPNTAESIYPVLKQVQTAVAEQRFEVKIGAAAEYMVDNVFTPEPGLLTLPGNYILIEMSYLAESPNIEHVVFDLQLKGYEVILAHPERYGFYHRNPDKYRRLKDLGCLFQLNLLSVVGYYGKGVKKAAEELLDRRSYDFAGTDLHHNKHMEILSSAITGGQLYKLIGQYPFKNKEVFSGRP